MSEQVLTITDMLRSRPFLKIRFTCSSAGNTRQQGASMTVRTFRLPLTLFNTFNIFPRTGQCAFPWAVGHGQQRAKRVSCAFFSVAPYRTAPAVRPSEECTALVETDRDFADRNPPPHSSPKHSEPFDILIGDGRSVAARGDTQPCELYESLGGGAVVGVDSSAEGRPR